MERNTVTHVPHPPGNTTRKCHLPTHIQDEGNDALLDIQAQHIGAIIGTVCCAAPTCADDVALIASTESGEVSTLLTAIETHASVVLQYPAGRKTPSVDLQINGCVLDSEPTATHLGVLQGAARTINTQQIGTYALFGAGLYGYTTSTSTSLTDSDDIVQRRLLLGEDTHTRPDQMHP